MIFISFEKNLLKISTKTQQHFNLFHAMHNFFKTSFVKSRSSKEDKNLIGKSDFVVKTNRINFEFCLKNGE